MRHSNRHLSFDSLDGRILLGTILTPINPYGSYTYAPAIQVLAPVVQPGTVPVAPVKAIVVPVSVKVVAPVITPINVASPHGMTSGTITSNNGTYTINTSTVSDFTVGGKTYGAGYTLKITGSFRLTNQGSLTVTMYNGTTQVGTSTLQTSYFHIQANGPKVSLTF